MGKKFTKTLPHGENDGKKPPSARWRWGNGVGTKKFGFKVAKNRN